MIVPDTKFILIHLNGEDTIFIRQKIIKIQWRRYKNAHLVLYETETFAIRYCFDKTFFQLTFHGVLWQQ